jgi:hypothetical protein
MSAEMKIVISADDKASAVIKSIGSGFDGLKAKISSAFDSLKTNFTNLHFIVTDIIGLLDKAFAAIERYAGFAEVKEQLNLMAGQFGMTGTAIVQAMKEVSAGQFSIEQATKAAASALKNSLTPEQIIGLTQAAAAFNDVAGVSIPEAFERLADAVQKGSARAAISIVGKAGLGDAMRELGSGVDDAANSGAIYEAIMAKTAAQTALTAGATQSLGDSIDKAKAQWSDFTLKISQFATTGAYGVAGVFYALAAALTRVAAAATSAFSALQSLSFDFKGAAASMQVAKDLWASATDLSAQADGFMKLAGAVGSVDKVAKTSEKAITQQAAALDANAAAVAAANAKWQLINGTWTQVQSQAGVVAAGFQQIKTAADSIPKNVQVKVTTTYVDARNSAPTSSAPSPAAAALGNGGGPDGTAYGNWGGAY